MNYSITITLLQIFKITEALYLTLCVACLVKGISNAIEVYKDREVYGKWGRPFIRGLLQPSLIPVVVFFLIALIFGTFLLITMALHNHI